ncbi:hypothetical protein [Haladaptatus sp. NG-SE-30]
MNGTPNKTTTATSPNPTDQSISAGMILTAALRRLRTTPSAVLVLVVAGGIVTGSDWLRLHDPVPTGGFTGVQNGKFSVAFGIVITILSRATVPLSALIDVKSQWLAWIVGLELLGYVAVVGAGAYALARLLGVSLTAPALVRYAAIVALLRFVPGRINLQGTGLVLAIPLIILGFMLLVRLFALPGLLVMGYSVHSALSQSWQLAVGRGWALFGVILVVGGLNHLLASAPVVGPLGSGLAGVLHAGTVAVFLDQTGAAE